MPGPPFILRISLPSSQSKVVFLTSTPPLDLSWGEQSKHGVGNIINPALSTILKHYLALNISVLFKHFHKQDSKDGEEQTLISERGID